MGHDARWRTILVVLVLVAPAVGAPAQALAHIEVVPLESVAGDTQRYGIRVPTEKPLPTVRVEAQFPSALRVLDLETTTGWRVITQRDSGGRIVDAVWEGGSIPVDQFAEFGLRARNPDADSELHWSVIQTYQDGSEVQWVGPASAEFPAATTRVRSRAWAVPVELLAGAAVAVSLLAVILAARAWRRGRVSP